MPFPRLWSLVAPTSSGRARRTTTSGISAELGSCLRIVCTPTAVSEPNGYCGLFRTAGSEYPLRLADVAHPADARRGGGGVCLGLWYIGNHAGIECRADGTHDAAGQYHDDGPRWPKYEHPEGSFDNCEQQLCYPAVLADEGHQSRDGFDVDTVTRR